MITQAPARARLVTATVFALSCVGLIVFVWAEFGGQIPFAPQGYMVQARFAESGLLVPGADVRVSGIDIGRVTAVQPVGVDSRVTMQIGPAFAPLPADTRAILRQKTLLGEAYVDLSTGNGRAPRLRDGGEIPSAQVAPAQGLDQVLSTFDPATQRGLRSLLAGTYSALYGQGRSLNDAAGNLAPVAAQTGAVVSGLDRERAAVAGLVRNTGTVLSAVGTRTRDLHDLLSAGGAVLSATAARDAQLTATVNALPPLLGQLRAVLRALDRTLALAGPTIATLVPVGGLVRPELSDLLTLSGPALTLLHQAPGLLDAADRALPAIGRFADELDPAVRTVLPAVENIVPMVQLIGDYRGELTASMANMAAALEATAPAAGVPGAVAHYARVLPPLNNEMFFGQSVREPSNRHNAYIAPGGWSHWASGLLSSDCANTGDAAEIPVQTGGNLPCAAARGWRFGGLTQYYPHVQAARPKTPR